MRVEMEGQFIEGTELLRKEMEALMREKAGSDKIEEVLKKSEEFSSILLNYSPNPIIVINPDTSVRYVNPALKELTGFSSSELIGVKAPYPWWTQETLKKTSKDFSVALRKGARRVKELFQNKNGERFWVEITSTPVMVNGELKYYLSSWVDITEHEQVERALRESKELFEKTFASQLDALFVLDAKNPPTILDCNPAAVEMFGYTRQEMLGLTTAFLNVNEKALRNFQEHLYTSIAKDGFLYGLEFHMRRKDGTVFPTEHSVMPLKDKQGKRIGWVSIVRDITERKQAEEALRESEDRYRGLFENSIEGVFATDIAGHYTSVNKAVEEITGYSREEIVGASYRKFVSPETAEFLFEQVNKLFRTGEPIQSIVYDIIRKDGERRTVEGYVNVIKKGNRVVGFQGTVKDITEHKQAEISLRESEERYRRLFENSIEGVFAFDIAGHFTSANEAMEKITGYPKEELIGMSYKKVTSPESAQSTFKAYNKLFRTGKPIRSLVYEIVRKDGERRLVEGYANVIRKENEIVGFQGTHRDITERKKAEDSLRESEERYRALFENSIDGVFTTDVPGKFTSVNKAMEELTGYRLEELLRTASNRLVVPEDRDIVFKEYNNMLRTCEPVRNVSYRMLRKDGERRLVEGYANVIKEGGKVVGFQGTIRDVTEYKKVEEALRKSEEHFRSLIEKALDGVMIVDNKAIISYQSPSIRQILGYKPEEVVGKRVFDFIHPENMPDIIKAFSQLAQKSGYTQSIQLHVLHKDGSLRVIEGIANNLLDNPYVRGIVINYHDITERRETEEQLKHSFVEMAETVSRAMGSRDPYTAGHQQKVAGLARLVGEKIGLNQHRLYGLYIGGLLHDCGKISIPASILTKPGELTEEEWDLICAHTKQGYKILKDTDLPWPVAEMALHHHERLDGSGYPHGIRGDELNLEVRILAVCDLAEAMSSYRPYRPARSKEEIIAEIESGRGTKYDAAVAGVVLQIIKNEEFEFSCYK